MSITTHIFMEKLEKCQNFLVEKIKAFYLELCKLAMLVKA